MTIYPFWLGSAGTNLSACLTGGALGWTAALAVAAITGRGAWLRTLQENTVEFSRLNRREYSGVRLREMQQRLGASTGEDIFSGRAAHEEEESWESESSDLEEEEEDEVDEEYDAMEQLQLKMVFVVRSTVQPRLMPQELAVLTATAGIELVELLNSTDIPEVSPSAPPSTIAPLRAFSSTVERQCWLRWYVWWNRIGCAKITLKCPDKDTLASVIAAARERGLPLRSLKRTQLVENEAIPPKPDKPVSNAHLSFSQDDAVVVAIGPAPSALLQPITGSLKLFS